MAGKSKAFYITTPIYYVNDSPHIGHAYTTIACDVMARFMRLDGAEVKFLTGTDEHGQKVDKAAAAAGKAPLAFCDEVSQRFRHLVKDPNRTDGGANILNASNNDFIRTTEPRHLKACQALWEKLKESGHIYLDEYDGWYSVRDEAYYAESELIEKDGKKLAPTGAEVEWVREESYFFQLSVFGKKLLEFYDKNPDFIVPQYRMNEVKQFVKSGLQDLSVSRTKFGWGIPVPERKGHVMYVWIDALTNYLTAVGYPDVNGEEYKKFWAPDDEAKQREEHPEYVRGNAVHVIGKDILRFHAVYWPAMLMAANLPLPKQIVAHGWWTIEGEKMSKSLGNVLSPQDMITKAGGVDQLRYFMLAAMPFGNDGDFAQSRMVENINADLANNIGNLAQRTLSLIQKNCDGKVPEFDDLLLDDLDDDDKALLKEVQVTEKSTPAIVRKRYENGEFREVLDDIKRMGFYANEYIDKKAPWTKAKTNMAHAHTILYHLAEAVRCIAIMLQPFAPSACAKILVQVGYDEKEANAGVPFTKLNPEFALKPGTVLPVPQGVFPRLQVEAKK